MDRQKLFLVLVSLGLVITSFQNCAGTSFSQLEPEQKTLTTAPPTPPPPPLTPVPICRDLKANEVKPKLKWDWKSQLSASAAPTYPSFDQVMASPMVADLDGDQIPEVLFVAFTKTISEQFPDAPGTVTYTKNGILRIVDGPTGITKLSVASQELAPFASQSPLLLDIDGDGKVEIFYIHYSMQKVVALNYDGSQRWIHDLGAPISAGLYTGLTAADTDSNGIGEILAAQFLISEDNARKPYVVANLNSSPYTSHSSLALPLNPKKPSEIHLVTPTGIYAKDGSTIATFARFANYLAAADIDKSIEGTEIIATGNSRLMIYNGLDGSMIRDIDLTSFNDLLCTGKTYVGGGPASVGDFDGDPSTLEIAVATGRHLTIFDSQGNVKYKTTTQDCSSLVTGLTSFDLNGDGKPEVLYSDEEYLRIFEVRNGALEIVYSIVNPSGTLLEYPVVADVDGDGYANILLSSNSYAAYGFYKDPGEENDLAIAVNTTGVRLFSSENETAWMPTRPIWNQYSFHPDLVSNGARMISSPSYDTQIFRRNNQGTGPSICVPF